MAYTTIDKPTDHFNIVLYTGNATNGRAVTGVGFQPDLNIIKSRTTTDKWWWVDIVRGASREINSGDTQEEQYKTDAHQSFDSDGFTVGTRGVVNGSGYSFCSWNWKGGGTASSNSNGSITSSVSANATAGFSIVGWTGDGSDATIGHGLSSAPKLIIHKHRSGTVQWNTYADVTNAGTGGYLRIDGTNAWGSNSGFFGTAPTATVFYPGSHSYMSGSGNDNIAYCFANVKGYSKIGEYTGNNSTNGTFVYLGFRPAFLMIKRTTNTGAWLIYDSTRYPENDADDPNKLYWNEPGSEDLSTDPGGDTNSTNAIDLLSNGFKLKSNNTYSNGAEDYIYYAVAENPFVSSGGVPATAR